MKFNFHYQYKQHFIIPCFALFLFACDSQAQDSLPIQPDTITFKSGDLQLKGLLWKPEGKGPFPAVLFNHGSEANSLGYVGTVAQFFLREGYAFFVPFRRGQSLSKGQGQYIIDARDSVFKLQGRDAALRTIMRLHETDQLTDQMNALKTLNSLPGIDQKRIAVAGISFGGIQTMLMATQKTNIKAAVNFAGAAMMWDSFVVAQQWMKEVATKARIPVFFVQAENDFSIQPSLQMAAVLKEQKKEHDVKIYPPNGTTAMDGHRFVRRGDVWSKDVFDFLRRYLK